MTRPVQSRWVGVLLATAWSAVAGAAAVAGSGSGGAPERVISITAQRFHYTPGEVVLKKGVPVILELTSRDRMHGFDIPELGIRADVVPGHPVRIRLTPGKAGTFAFHCDLYCGVGHERMTGRIRVRD